MHLVHALGCCSAQARRTSRQVARTDATIKSPQTENQPVRSRLSATSYGASTRDQNAVAAMPPNPLQPADVGTSVDRLITEPASDLPTQAWPNSSVNPPVRALRLMSVVSRKSSKTPVQTA